MGKTHSPAESVSRRVRPALIRRITASLKRCPEKFLSNLNLSSYRRHRKLET